LSGATPIPYQPYVVGIERPVGESEIGPYPGLVLAPDTVATLRNPSESFTSFWVLTATVEEAEATPEAP
jgi:hypothetical protein